METKEIKVSTTDPESGYMVRDGKPEGFFYLDHRTVDHKYNIITDVYVTAGNVHDSTPYIERLEHQIEKFGLQDSLEAVALDSGYLTAAICKKLHDKKIFAVIGGRAYTPTKGLIQKWRFKYNAEKDIYVCPKNTNSGTLQLIEKGTGCTSQNPSIVGIVLCFPSAHDPRINKR